MKVTKHFCDICGKPAWDNLSIQGRRNVGEPYRRARSSSLGEEISQTVVYCKVHFGFTDHPTGFAGPPDICRQCVREMVQCLLDAIPQEEVELVER